MKAVYEQHARDYFESPPPIIGNGTVKAIHYIQSFAPDDNVTPELAHKIANKNINGIKSKTVGDGQHGTARWATKPEIKRTFFSSPFTPGLWRQGKNLPTVQGTIVACRGGKNTTALIDTGDVHTLMIGAAGVGKTAYFLYPNIEFACASGMSFLSTDTKGDVARNYGAIARDCYGYNVSVIDLRNPTRSDENNILHLVNKYMDIYLADKNNLSAKAKAEKYAKITAKTIINIGGGDSANYGQNAFFYDAAEGLLSSVILLLAEFGEKNERHIVSVFKLIQDLIAKPPAKSAKDKPKMYFTTLMDKLPSEHKAKWLAGAALNSADQSMMSVMSTALSKGQFIVMKTGTHPMISKLKLYFKWGIKFGKPFILDDRGARRVEYASRDALMAAVEQKYPQGGICEHQEGRHTALSDCSRELVYVWCSKRLHRRFLWLVQTSNSNVSYCIFADDHTLPGIADLHTARTDRRRSLLISNRGAEDCSDVRT